MTTVRCLQMAFRVARAALPRGNDLKNSRLPSYSRVRITLDSLLNVHCALASTVPPALPLAPKVHRKVSDDLCRERWIARLGADRLSLRSQNGRDRERRYQCRGLLATWSCASSTRSPGEREAIHQDLGHHPLLRDDPLVAYPRDRVHSHARFVSNDKLLHRR